MENKTYAVLLWNNSQQSLTRRVNLTSVTQGPFGGLFRVSPIIQYPAQKMGL